MNNPVNNFDPLYNLLVQNLEKYTVTLGKNEAIKRAYVQDKGGRFTYKESQQTFSTTFTNIDYLQRILNDSLSLCSKGIKIDLGTIEKAWNQFNLQTNWEHLAAKFPIIDEYVRYAEEYINSFNKIVDYSIFNEYIVDQRLSFIKQKESLGNTVCINNTFITMTVDGRSPHKIMRKVNNRILDVSYLRDEIQKIYYDALELSETPLLSKNMKIDAILNPGLAAQFIHECLGHISEADLLLRNPGLMSRYLIGNKVAPTFINIYDDPYMLTGHGKLLYDDDGNLQKKVKIIENGILKAYMHSSDTSIKLNLVATGHSWSETYRNSTRVRQTNLVLQSGSDSQDEMINKINNGILLQNGLGGKFFGDKALMKCEKGYLISDGKVCSAVKDIKIIGNIFEMIGSISCIGSDSMTMYASCIKDNQNKEITYTSPSILIEGLEIVPSL